MKFRFPILAKIAILGTLTSVIAAGISIAISFINQINRSQKNLMDNIDNTLDSIRFSYKESDDAEGNRSGLAVVKEKAASYYEDPEVKEANLSDFDTFAEYEDYMKDRAVWFYPPSGIMIGSMQFIEFRNALAILQSSITVNQYSSGATACFVAYLDEDTGSYVFLADSRYGRTKEGEFYHLAASHYTLKESDTFIESHDTYDTYMLNGYSTKLITINDEQGAEIATFFIQYSTAQIEADNMRLLWGDIAILSVTSIAIIGIIVLASYLMFTRNVVKLTKAAESFTKKLGSSDTLQVEEVTIRSNDEVKTLSDAFTGMETQIVDYIDIIKAEAADKERRAAELNVASKIQLEALPPLSYEDSKVAIEAYIAPAKEVGGDFYDYFYLGDKLAIIISDVSGKGVPAALFMMRGKELVKSKLQSGISITQSIKEANDSLCQNNEENLFITSFIGIIDFEKEEMTYVNAGHEKPYVLSNGKLIKLDGVCNFVLGGMEDMEYVSESTSFKKGDKIFLFTDGLNESIDRKEREFGYDNIVSSLKESMGLGLRETINHMEAALKKFVGDNEPFDDTTMMIVENRKEEFHLVYKKKDYAIIEEAVDAFDKHFKDLSEALKSKVGIILDELMNNLISYEEREDLIIEVSAKVVGEELILVVSDNGSDYDIVKRHKEKYATSDKDVGIGGFGITIVKDLAKDVSYHYEDGHSIVTITMDTNG